MGLIFDSAKMIRTYTYTAKLSSKAHWQLDEFFGQRSILWNSELEERIDAYWKKGMSLCFCDQAKSLTQVGSDDTVFIKFHLASKRTALFRLGKAFRRF